MTVDDHDQRLEGEHRGKESVDIRPTQERSGPMSATQWRVSPERKAIRTTATICLVIIIIPSLIAAAFLAKWQQNLNQAIYTAGLTVNQAETSLRQRTAIENNYRIDLAKAQGRGDSQSEITSIQTQVDTAALKTQQALATLNSDQIAQVTAESHRSGVAGTWLLYSGCVGAGIILAVLIFTYVRSEKLRTYESGQILDDLQKSGRSENPLDLVVLWNNNRDQLASYHKLILNYASSTRQATIATLLAGFCFFIVIGIVAFFARNTPAAVAASVVAAVGATVTGFVGNGVLRNAETSSREVLSFFSHPLDIQRALAAERIINSMPEPLQQEARLLLVRALTQARTYDSSGAASRTSPESEGIGS